MSGSTTTINGAAGGLLQDQSRNTVVQLGSNAASVLVGLGTDTILGGSGAAGVFAFNDTNNLDVVGGSGSLAVSLLFATGNATISGGSAGETVTGGLGNIKLTQAGALTLHPSNGTITIAANGKAITIWASDNSGYEVFTPTAGTTVTVAPTPDGYGHTLVTVGNSPAVALGNGFETVGSSVSYLTGASASTFGNTIIPTPATPVVTGLLVGTSGFTSSTTPSFTGTAVAGDEVLLYIDGYTQIGETIANASGAWTIAASQVLSGGTHTVMAEVLDISGVLSNTSNPYTVVIDTTGPDAPVIKGIDVSTDSGTVGDSTTNVRHVEIDGTSDPYDTIVLYDGTSSIGTGVSNASGTWSVTSTVALTDGAHNLTAVATDPLGFTGPASSVYVVTIQTTPPLAPTNVTLDPGSDSGVVGDNRTNAASPVIDGAALPNEIITVAADGLNLGTVSTDQFGDWSFAVPTVLTAGTHVVSATATNTVGNISAATTLNLTITNAAPAPFISGVVATTGTITSNDITNAGTVVLSGTAEQGATIAVLDGTTTVGTAIANNGSWSDQVGLVLGQNTLTAVVRYDAAGNSSKASNALVINAISSLVAAPTIAGLAPASQTGTSGNHTNLTSPTLVGTGIAGDVVTLLNGTTVLGTGTVVSTGSWSVAVTTALPFGQDSITAKQTNLLGQASAASVAATVTVSAIPGPPVISGISGAVASNGSVVATTANPTIVGTGPAGDLITLLNNGTILATTTAAATGSWSAQPSTNFTSGTYGLTAEATDAAGDISAQSAPLSVLVSLAKPVQVGTNLPFGIAANVAIPSQVTYYSYQQTPPTPAPGSSLGLTVDNSDLNDVITVPAATNVVSDVANGAVTLVGGGNNQLFLSTGSNATTTFESNGGSGVYLANQAAGGTSTTGNSFVYINNSAAGASGNYLVDTGSGNNVIQAITGNDSIAAGTGSNTIQLGSGNHYVMDTGTDVVSCDTVIGGADTVNASADANSIEIFANSSNLTFLGGPGGSVIIGGALPMNVLGWAGSDTVWGSSGGGQYWGGEAGNSYLEAGTGSGSCTLAGGNGNNNFLVADNAASDVLAAGGGYETLLGGSSTGGNQYFSGPGNTVIQAGQGKDVVSMDAGNTTVFAGAHTLTFANAAGIVVASSGQQTIMGGGPSEIYGFTSASGGGSTVIENFNPNQDQIALWNYSSSDLTAALAGQTSAGGNTTVTLSDNTRITFMGVQHVDSSGFSAS